MHLLYLTGLPVSRFRPSILILAVAFATLGACDKMSLVSPTGSTITLTANKTSVAINGTAEITASVIESAGTPVQNGTVVTFTSSFGNVEPREARTEGGTARVMFTGTQSGLAKIGAFSGGAKTTAELEVRVGAAAAETLRLRAEPPTIPQSGGSSQIVVTVNDASGGPLANAPVLFTTDGGSVSPGSATTDANGEARTTLTTSRTSKVTATVGAKTGDVTVTVVNAPTVTISCGAANATNPAGVPVNCTVTPAAGAGSGSAISNVTINWGDGTGEQPLGNVTGATTVSHTYASPGTYTATASATDQNGQRGTGSTTVVVTRVTPVITITGPASGTVGVPVTFTVTVAANPNPPLTNVTVDFGDGTSRNLGTPTGSTSVSKTYSSDGTFTATATATDQAGTRGSSSTQILINRSAPPTVTFTQTSDFSTPATPAVPETFSVSATASTGLVINSIVVTRDSTGEVLYSGSGGGSFAARVAATEVLTATATDSGGNTTRSQLVVR
jgi:hypothetical protein